MPIIDDILAAAKGDAPAAAATPQPQQAQDAPSDSPIVRAIMNPVGSALDESLKQGLTWDQTSERLKNLGSDPQQFADKKQYFDLANKKKELAGRGLSFSQSYRNEDDQPWGSVFTIPESVLRPADYLSREISRLGGKEQDVGGRVVGNNEYDQATKRFAEGKAGDDDIDAIAVYEHHAQVRQAVHKGANFGQKFVLELGALSKLAIETMTGTRLLSGAVRLAMPARAAATTLAGAAPAVPAAAAGLGTQAGNLALATAVTPSMYVPMMQQANMRAGRDANDFRGLPTSFGYAYANMLVLGRLGGGAQTQASLAYQSLRKGVFGVAEMQTVDAAAGVVDQFLPQAYQIRPDDERWGNVGAWLRASRAGDGEKQSEVLRDATVQALAFSAFAAVHGREVKGTDLTQAFADTVGTLRGKGMSKTRAGEVIGELHVKLEDALSADPYLSREGAREALGKDLPAELKPYAEKLAETFEPAAKLPTPAEVKEAMPKPAGAAEVAKPGETPKPAVPAAAAAPDAVQVEGRKPGDYSKVTAVDPTEPNPDRRVTVEHSDATVEKLGVDALSAPSPAAAATPAPAAPTVLAAGTRPTARERADELTSQHRDLQAAYLETSRAADVAERNAKGGGSLIAAKALRKAASGLDGKLKKLVRELESARSAAILEGMARPPKSSAATTSEAPSVPVEPAKIPTPVTPAEATKTAAAATAAPAAGVWKYDGMRTPDTKVDSLASHMADSNYNLAKRLGHSEQEARQGAREAYQNYAFGAEEAPARVKPPEEPETHTAATLTNKLHYLVDNSPGLDRGMRQHFKASMTTAMSRLPAAAAARVGANLKDAKFYRSPLAAAEAHARERLDDPGLSDAERDKWQAHLAKFEQGVHSAVGAFNEKTGTLYIDGAAAVGREHGVHGYEGVLEASQIAGHESGHTLDGPGREYSSDPRFTSAYLAEIGGVKHKAMAEPPLTKYATATRAEGFAEFSRLLYATDVPTERIESEFPKTSKFFKERGLWPEERQGKAEPIKEVFNERIGDDSSHVDAKNDAVKEGVVVSEPESEPAAAAEKPISAKEIEDANPFPAAEQLTAPKPKKKRAGERKKPEPNPEPVPEPEVAVEPAADWRKLDEGDTLADKRVLYQMAQKYKGTEAESFLRDAQSNLPGEASYLHGKDRRKQTITELDHVLSEAEDAGKPAAVAALREAVEHFGGKFLGEVGKTVPYNHQDHETKRGEGTSAPMDANTPVLVKRQGVQIYDDGKWNRTTIADNAEGNWYTPVKAVVEKAPAAAATPKAGAANPAKPKLEGQDWWNSLSTEQKAEAYNTLGGKGLRKQGIDFSDLSRKDKAGLNRQLEGLEPHIEDVKDNADAARLSTSERTALAMTLEGKTQDAIGKKLGGVSHTSIRNYVTRALAKMQKVSTLWTDFKSAQDLIDAGQSENARQKELAANSYAAATRERMDKAGNRTKASGLEAEEPGGFSELRIKALARVFGPSDGRSVWQRLSGLFFGNLPTSARAAKEQEIDGQIAAYAFDVKNAADDLTAALKGEHKPYEQLSKSELKGLDTVLRTKPTDPAYAAVRSGVGAKTLAALDVMRSQVDKLSTALMDVGAVESPLAATVTDNLGAYLTRQFQVFRDPGWESKVDPAVVNRFKSWLSNQLIAAGGRPTPEEIDSITKSLLRDGTAAENPIAFLKKSLLGAKDLSILKARKDIPEELRALWGEYEDPLVNYANSVAKMAHLLTAHNFLSRVAVEGRNKFFFDGPTGEHVHQITSDENPALKPLSGVYTTLEIKKAFEQQFAKESVGWGMQWYMKALAAAKFNKVILSHVGQIHNFMSNVLIAVRNGHFNLSKAPAAVVNVFKNNEAGRDYWRKLTTLGVVGEGLHYNDFQKTVSDAMGGRDHFAGLDGGHSVLANSLLGRMLRGAGKRAALLYNYGDAVWKVYGFENEKAKYQAAGLSEKAAEAKAAEIVRDTMPTYSKIAPGIQALRKSPLLSPFIAFQAEMVRTTKNNLLLAVKELKDPATRGIGAKRLAGMAAAATIPVALAAASRAMFGVDDSEEKALRRYLPDWQKNSRLVYFGRDPKTGHPRSMDLSRIDPHAYLSDGLIAFMRGKDSSDGVKNAAAEWAKPFTQEELLLRPGIDIARNSKEPGGQVYNPQAPTLTQAGDVAAHAGEPFVPAAYGPVRRMAKALAGSSEQKSGREYNASDTAIEQAGVRIESPRVREDLANKALGFEKAKKDADKMVSDMIHAKGGVSGEELKRARDMTEEARKRAMDEFRLDVQAAERLNVPRKEIAAILKSSGVSVLEIGQLFSATQVPYLPKLAGSATERERAGQVRRLASPSQP